MDHIAVVYISDENYAVLTGVSINSIKVNRDKNLIYDIYILANQISKDKLNCFLTLAEHNFNIIIEQIDFQKNQYKIDDFHVTSTATLKFDLPYIFNNLDKILYLDGDVLVQKDLKELYNINIENEYAAVVKDLIPMLLYNPSIFKMLNINHENYFNSGVMLLNLKKMRSDMISEKLHTYRENGINYFMDQDALNVVLGKNVKYISLYNNYMTTLWNKVKADVIIKEYNLDRLTDINSYCENAVIIHLTGPEKPDVNKPWKIKDKFYADLIKKYYLSSPFKKYALKVPHKNINKKIKELTLSIKIFIKKLLVKLKIL